MVQCCYRSIAARNDSVLPFYKVLFMIKKVLFLLVVLMGSAAQAQTSFNKQLADSLKADAYGMKNYVMVFLKKGPNRNQDSATAQSIQNGHMENIRKLAAEGKLIVAGPFLGNGDLRGIFILNVANLEEAKRLTETDPAVKSGRLVMELHPWYGSAALMMVSPIHNTIASENP